MYSSTWFAAPAAALLFAGCASHPPPFLQIANARAAIAAATLESTPTPAGEELSRAREKLALADRWMAARDHQPARWLAEQAEVDAELAAAKSANAAAQRALLTSL
jgi:hypothetical protein